MSKSNKSAESSTTRSTQCLDRSTLVALFAALGMFSALAIALLCYVIWDLLVSSFYQQIFLEIMGYPKPSNKAQWLKVCRKGNLEAVEFFVDIGQDVDVADSDGYTGLMLACLNGEADVVHFVLSKGAHVDHRTTTKGYSALLCAAAKGHLEVCKLLVAKGADVNQGTNSGWSPWLEACEKGHLDIVKFFVIIGQDVEATAENGDTGLIAASSEGKADVVRFLLSKGARVDHWATGNGYSALSIAAFNGHLDVCKLLVAKGADANQNWNDGLSPWFAACAKGHLDIVQFFVDNGQDVEATRKARALIGYHCQWQNSIGRSC